MEQIFYTVDGSMFVGKTDLKNSVTIGSVLDILNKCILHRSSFLQLGTDLY